MMDPGTAVIGLTRLTFSVQKGGASAKMAMKTFLLIIYLMVIHNVQMDLMKKHAVLEMRFGSAQM